MRDFTALICADSKHGLFPIKICLNLNPDDYTIALTTVSSHSHLGML